MGIKTQPDSIVSELNNDGEQLRLMRDAVVNNLSMIVSALVGLLLVPVMLRALGQEKYGLWIVVTSFMGTTGVVDFGLGFSINRVVAADPARSVRDNADFIRSAANVYLLIGITGCIILCGSGLLSADKLHLPHVERATILLVFVLFGAAFFLIR